MEPTDRKLGEGAGDRPRRLVDIGIDLLSDLDLESVLHSVVERARELTGARYAALGVIDRDGEELERFIYVGLDAATRRAIGALPRGRGVLGELIRTPKPLRLADVNQHPHAYGFPAGHPPMKSFLGVPVIIDGAPFGNLYMTEKQGAPEFSTEDEKAIESLAAWAAIAIENARRFTLLKEQEIRTERALRQAQTSADIARAVGGETEAGKVLDLVAKRARALVDARALFVVLRRPENLKVAARAGHRHLADDAVELALDDAVLLATFESRAAIHLHRGSPPTLASLRDRLHADSVLLVPLLFRGRAVGCLVALDRELGGTDFDHEDLGLLQAFADTAATAVATAQTIEADRLQQRIEVGERERERWARELHDGALQELVAIRFDLSSALQGAGAEGAEAMRSAAQSAVERLEQQVEEISRLINDLSPAPLERHGLAGALAMLTEECGSRGGFATETEIEIEAKLNGAEERAAYRLVQEALHNVLKHAQPSKVKVSSRIVDNHVLIEIEDDGRGFDPDATETRLGLRGMRERIEMLGGEIAIRSQIGAGTRVSARIPRSLAG